MILSLYVARRFLWLFARIFAGFFALLMIFDLVEELRRFGGKGLGLADALQLSAMNVPPTLYRILPLIMILSAIGLFLSLARSSELVVIRAAGRSGLRFLVAPVVTALAIGLFAVAVMNPIVAATAHRYEVLSAALGRGGSVFSVGEGGLWLRQGGAGGQSVIHAARSNPDGTELFDVTFLTFDAQGQPARRIEAEEARLAPGVWRLGPATTWPLSADNPERDATQDATDQEIPTDLTSDKIRDSFGKPEGIAIWDLPDYIDGLKRAGFSARGHLVWLQAELALPLFLAAQVLLAAGFTMRHVRAQRTGLYVLMAMLSGFGVYFLRNFGRVLGENGQVPILAAAWTPPVAVMLLALSLILFLEDG